MKNPTKAQLAVLEEMAKGARLFRASGGGVSRFGFHGAALRIHAATGFALFARCWIASVPRTSMTPSWRTDYELTDAGREAIK